MKSRKEHLVMALHICKKPESYKEPEKRLKLLISKKTNQTMQTAALMQL